MNQIDSSAEQSEPGVRSRDVGAGHVIRAIGGRRSPLGMLVPDMPFAPWAVAQIALAALARDPQGR